MSSLPICASCWGHEAFGVSSKRCCNALSIEWEQQNVHRDVKASNKLVDAELNEGEQYVGRCGAQWPTRGLQPRSPIRAQEKSSDRQARQRFKVPYI